MKENTGCVIITSLFIIGLILIGRFPIIGAILVSIISIYFVYKLIKSIWEEKYYIPNKKKIIIYKLIKTILLIIILIIITMCSYNSKDSDYTFSDYIIDRIP